MAIPITQITEVLTPSESYVINRNRGVLEKIYFVLCDSCLWTASFIYNFYSSKKIPSSNCPMCDKPAKYLLASTRKRHKFGHGVLYIDMRSTKFLGIFFHTSYK